MTSATTDAATGSLRLDLAPIPDGLAVGADEVVVGERSDPGSQP